MSFKRTFQRMIGTEGRAMARVRAERAKVAPTLHLAAADGAALALAGQAVVFGNQVKHGIAVLPSGVPVGFEDPNGAPFFIGAGWAEPVDGLPVYVFPQSVVEIDPATVHADDGRAVLGG